mmetsp:Transcript_8591/g.31731  ORF Transcript_8591/g.31731 Transcript_8591/m.31731 type:complete len:352 (+) Transcript_8591:169-1224(+)
MSAAMPTGRAALLARERVAGGKAPSRCLRLLCRTRASGPPHVPRSRSPGSSTGAVGFSRPGTLRDRSSLRALATDAEREAWKRRERESGQQHVGEWKWTLNWNEITPEVLVGSCPRSPEDATIIARESGATAILCLQSNDCFRAMNIDWEAIRERAISEGVVMARVSVRDFDHNDQALMLPEGVRVLSQLVASGHKVYVHCTAGINRATLVAVGYLTFYRGKTLDDAVSLVKSKRSIANPYIDCWKRARSRMLNDRDEELGYLSKEIYEERCNSGRHGNMDTDWKEAQIKLIQRDFKRYVDAQLSVHRSVQDTSTAKDEGADTQRLDSIRMEAAKLLSAIERLEKATNYEQ